MNPQDLVNKSKEELMEIAKSLNIKVHPASKPDTIVYKILQQPQASQNAAMQHAAEQPKAATIHNSEEDIREAIKDYASKEGYSVTFPGDGTWLFKYRGAEECGNMSIPLRVIRMKAATIARGARHLMAYSPNDGFDTAVAKNYANNVLM